MYEVYSAKSGPPPPKKNLVPLLLLQGMLKVFPGNLRTIVIAPMQRKGWTSLAQPLGLGVGGVIQRLLFKQHKGSLDIANPFFVHLPGVAAQRFALFPLRLPLPMLWIYRQLPIPSTRA